MQSNHGQMHGPAPAVLSLSRPGLQGPGCSPALERLHHCILSPRLLCPVLGQLPVEHAAVMRGEMRLGRGLCFPCWMHTKAYHRACIEPQKFKTGQVRSCNATAKVQPPCHAMAWQSDHLEHTGSRQAACAHTGPIWVLLHQRPGVAALTARQNDMQTMPAPAS